MLIIYYRAGKVVRELGSETYDLSPDESFLDDDLLEVLFDNFAERLGLKSGDYRARVYETNAAGDPTGKLVVEGGYTL